jgi:hypothetical protein
MSERQLIIPKNYGTEILYKSERRMAFIGIADWMFVKFVVSTGLTKHYITLPVDILGIMIVVLSKTTTLRII